MIYELSLDFFNSSHSAIRTIKVDNKMSFRQLHAVIQSAFNWTSIHPYIFVMHTSNYQQAIGDHRYIDHPLLHFYSRWQVLDSKKQMLSTWLKEPGDSITYEYYPDKEINFAVLVTLEKKKIHDSDKLYPIVTSAENMAIEEPHSRRFKLQTHAYNHFNVTPDSVDDYVGHLNTLVQENQQIINEPIHQKQDFYYDIVQDKLEDFVEKRPWEYLTEESVFSVIDPETDQQLFVQVKGFEKEAYALHIYVGEHSYLTMRQEELFGKNTVVYQSPLTSHQPYHELNVTFPEFEELDYLDRPKITYQNFSHFDDDPKLSSINHPQVAYPKELNSQELRFLSLALDQVFEVAELVEKGLDLTSEEIKGNVILERFYSPFYQKFINDEIYFTINEQYRY